MLALVGRSLTIDQGPGSAQRLCSGTEGQLRPQEREGIT